MRTLGSSSFEDNNLQDKKNINYFQYTKITNVDMSSTAASVDVK